MKEYFVKNGITDSVILVDNRGDNTLSSVENFLELKKEYHFKKVGVISQYFHISRTKMLMRNFGINEIGSASPMYFEWRDFYSITREFFAYYRYLLF